MDREMDSEEEIHVIARQADLRRAEAINVLLIRPIAILPSAPGDSILPFAIGLWSEIRSLLRPDESVTALRRATGAYLHSKAYHLATARRSSMRHDLDGQVVSEVSDSDRSDARERAAAVPRELRSQAETAGEQSAEQAAPQLGLKKNDMIRAGLLRRKTQASQ